MKVVFDIEANGLKNPDQIWCIVCKDIDTGKYYYFRNLTLDDAERNRFLQFATSVDCWIGHHILGYDCLVIHALLGLDFSSKSIDTLILSKLIDYPRGKHSIEDYGEEFGYPKGTFTRWNDAELRNTASGLHQELVTYCQRDVDICHKIYLKYKKYIDKHEHQKAIRLEHDFQWRIVNALEQNGFAFDTRKAVSLLDSVRVELGTLDADILSAFPPREVLIREFTPKLTKFGTISRSSVPRALHDKIHEYEAGVTYRHTKLEPFNPSSHKQLIDVLHEAGWQPVDKTKTHIEADRELKKLQRDVKKDNTLDLRIKELYTDLKAGSDKEPPGKLAKYGWKINEANLLTLPDTSPPPARLLAKRILLESRRRTLTEWLELVQPDGRIHGKFYGIGAWTHRMAHQNPNTANIPTEAKLYGHEMRALWRAPEKHLLVGVDAESIQLRIFAHYINDAEFTEALVKGNKDDKTDPHSLNQRILGAKTRAHAKRFIFAYLLGAGVGKLAEILDVTESEGAAALERLIDRYQGLQVLKETVIPRDAKRGWFSGLDGRSVRIPGETAGARKHLAMSGYLQNGEAVVMKLACLKWYEKLQTEILPKWGLVNFVHDEWQTEVATTNLEVAKLIAETQALALKEVGEELKLNCPLAGSFWNDDEKRYNIGPDWSVTH